MTSWWYIVICNIITIWHGIVCNIPTNQIKHEPDYEFRNAIVCSASLNEWCIHLIVKRWNTQYLFSTTHLKAFRNYPSYLRHGEGYVFIVVRCFVCLSVCLSVCLLATLRKTVKRIFMKFLGYVGLDTRNNWDHFQDVPYNPLNTGNFSTFSEESIPISSIAEKKVERIFTKFSEKDGHDTRSNLKHFRDVTVNPLNPGSIYLSPGSVFVYNIMEKRMNRFSWNFYETSGMTQEIVSRFHTWLERLTVSHLEYVAYGIRKNLDHLGDDRFNPLDTGLFFLFVGSVFVGNITDYRMDGHSWNFQDMGTRRSRLHCFTLE